MCAAGFQDSANFQADSSAAQPAYDGGDAADFVAIAGKHQRASGSIQTAMLRILVAMSPPAILTSFMLLSGSCNHHLCGARSDVFLQRQSRSGQVLAFTTL